MTWIQTYSGRKFDFTNLSPNAVHINDIAHALSHACRFAGHSRQFYSVAQHCVLVSKNCDRKDALAGLLHDATEAYISDVVSPLKRLLPDYQAMEQRVLSVIFGRFGLPPVIPQSVLHADLVLLSTEKRDLITETDLPWVAELPRPLPERIRSWTSFEAKAEYIARFEELTGL